MLWYNGGMGKSMELEELEDQVQATLLKWKEGIAVKSIMMLKQRRTFYRHRAVIIKAFGIDISEPVSKQIRELAEVKFHGEYLVRREAERPQLSLPGALRQA